MRRYNADSLIIQLSEIQRALVTPVDIPSSASIANGMLSLLVDVFFQVQSSAHISIHRRKTYFKWLWYLQKLVMCCRASQAGLGKLSASFPKFQVPVKGWWLVDPASLPVCWLLPVWFLKLWKRNHFLGAGKNGSGVKDTCFCRGSRFSSLHPYTGSQPLETPVLGIWCLLLTPMSTNRVYGTHTYMQAMALIHVKLKKICFEDIKWFLK